MDALYGLMQEQITIVESHSLALQDAAYPPDLEKLQLEDEVWMVTKEVAKTGGASLELSDKLRSLEFENSGVANSIGELDCIACGLLYISEQQSASSCQHRIRDERRYYHLRKLQ